MLHSNTAFLKASVPSLNSKAVARALVPLAQTEQLDKQRDRQQRQRYAEKGPQPHGQDWIGM